MYTIFVHIKWLYIAEMIIKAPKIHLYDEQKMYS